MKTALYVAAVARTYRRAMDDFKKDPALYEDNMEWYKAEMSILWLDRSRLTNEASKSLS